MEKQDYIDKLHEGVEVWNQWRKDYPEIQPDLSGAHLESLDLRKAHFEGTNLSNAYLGDKENSSTSKHPTNLQGAFFDKYTNLQGLILGNDTTGSVSLADVDWHDVNLAMVNWRQVKMLGDEFEARQVLDSDNKEKHIDTQIIEYEFAARANRQLAVALLGQGLNEHASYFAYRAQLNQRHLLKLNIFHELEQRRWLRFLIRKTRTQSSWLNLLVVTPMWLLFVLSLVIDIFNILFENKSLNLLKLFNFFIHDESFLLIFFLSIFVTVSILFILNASIRLFTIFLVSLFVTCILLYLLFVSLNFLISDIHLLYTIILMMLFLAWIIVTTPIAFLEVKIMGDTFNFFRGKTSYSRNLNDFTKFMVDSFRLFTQSKISNRPVEYFKTILRSVYSLIKPYANLEANYGRYIFSMFLDLLAGYGYKPIRSVRAYLLTIVVFASFYYVFSQGTHYEVSQLGAVVLSLTSFHGRGFFPGLNTNTNGTIPIDHPLIVLAAVEAVIGLVIEISFIATFTQRYFGK